jgi:SH3-like domain-containing protein
MGQQRAGAGVILRIIAAGAMVLATMPLAARSEEGVGPVTNLPLPRYVSLRSDKINVRRGPGLDYRKDWVFRREGLPVKIVDEYGDWRRIVDRDEAGGWVYHAMLTGRRTVLIVEDGVALRREPADAAAAAAMAEQGVVARLESCDPDWCRIEADGYKGWVRKSSLWGVGTTEVVED